MSQAAVLKGRNRPTRQAAAQHRYADMKVETNGFIYEEQVSQKILRRIRGHALCFLTSFS